MTHPPLSNQHEQHRQTVLNNLQATMERYGYGLVKIPVIDHAELFLTKAGDQVAERLFVFERNGTPLALRPEFTAAAAHRYITEGYDSPVRWQFQGAIFADDTVDSLHHSPTHYEHQSAGAELIGLAGAMAEAEIIVMAAQGIMAAGIDDWHIEIGHVGLTRHLLGRYALDDRTQRFILNHRHELANNPDALARYLPNVDDNRQTPDSLTQADTQDLLDILLNTSRAAVTMGGRTRHDIARRLLKKRQQAAQSPQIYAAVEFLRGWMSIHAPVDDALPRVREFIQEDDEGLRLYVEWVQMLDLLEAGGISRERVVIQPDLARTWDYYTGIVFDIRTDDGLQLAGGGRYDELTQLIGGEREIPAVGFAYDVEHLLTLKTTTPVITHVHYLSYKDVNPVEAMRWATVLRARGICLILDDATSTQTTFHLDDDGLHYQGVVYAFDGVDALIQAMNG